MEDYRVGNIKKKIILLLEAGVSFGLTRSFKKQRWILKKLPRELEKINRQTLNRAINSLYNSHLLRETHHKDGSSTLSLSKNGKKYALRFKLFEIKLGPPVRWDKKWRIIMFDIPERIKILRDSLRMHFKNMGLIEFQKSAFITPIPCEKEIEFILEFYNAKRYVRFILAEAIDNELHLQKKFGLI